MPTIVTIDGPSATGKSTVAQKLAAHHNLFYIGSGLLYRAAAYSLKEEKIDVDDEDRAFLCIQAMNLQYEREGGELNPCIKKGGQNITHLLYEDEIAAISSRISAYQKVRQYLSCMQRVLAQGKNTIVDGRDAGTYVFPEASCKIFLTASLAERARRLILREPGKSLEESIALLTQRDRNDTLRTHGPLKPADDAYLLDASQMNLDQVLQHLSLLLTNFHV